MTPVRGWLVRGLVSGLVHEAFVVVLSFAAMIVLVRLLTPADYGQAAAAVGVLAFVGAFRGAMFVEHALQHGKDEEPDWDTYFALVGLVQMTLCGVTIALSFAFAAWDRLASLSPLLRMAAIGFLFDWPAQVAAVKLRRELRFDRLKMLSGIAVVLRLATAVLLAWLGLGAMALIISGNVLSPVPMALAFLLVTRWRPRRGWLFVPRGANVRPVLRFGAQQIAVGFVQSFRTAAESLVLTNVFGTDTFGLLNRAQALYQSTVGRLGVVFVEAAYPLLPMERADPQRYAQRASRFLEAAFILSVPGAAFIALEGAAVSRLLYGSTWTGADPYLAPAAIAVAAGALVSAAAFVVMGTGRMHAAVIMETATATAAIATLAVALLASDPKFYAWAIAIAHAGAAVLAVSFAARHLEADWQRRGLWPAAAASAFGIAGVFMVRWWVPVDGTPRLLVSACSYAGLVTLTLTWTARPLVLELMRARSAFRWKRGTVVESQAQA